MIHAGFLFLFLDKNVCLFYSNDIILNFGHDDIEIYEENSNDNTKVRKKIYQDKRG